MDEISSRTIDPNVRIALQGTHEEVLEMLERLRKEAEAAVIHYNNVNQMCRKLRKNFCPTGSDTLVAYWK